ncbi:5-formyltetrahydrofolate cyclo-ligase [Robertkochia aurantiaca]|uniref:5-formyltetrahydrofolate cyclo-ligase n=1 Tax=Robertkochia aurantiaca TaxID=2873700 RepID=UPI001CCABAD0|nr:5-formyltetrahydrofolate cyclo-ligase [Robertkochia sp. 3YJGBD-33]
MMPTKPELRKKYRELRSQLSLEEIEKKSLAIANRALSEDIWKGTYYHLFLSIAQKREIDTGFMLSVLHGKDKQVVVPKSDFRNYTLEHLLLEEETVLRIKSYGIPEPDSGEPVDPELIDVVFIPLLAYDKRGYRVGYGKGFYDRFLKDCRKDVIKVGLSFFGPEEEIPDINPHDIPVDLVVTPDRCYRFST